MGKPRSEYTPEEEEDYQRAAKLLGRERFTEAEMRAAIKARERKPTDRQRQYRSHKQREHEQTLAFIEMLKSHPSALDWLILTAGLGSTTLITWLEAQGVKQRSEAGGTVRSWDAGTFATQAALRGLLGPIGLLIPPEKKIELPSLAGTAGAAISMTITQLAAYRLIMKASEGGGDIGDILKVVGIGGA